MKYLFTLLLLLPIFCHSQTSSKQPRANIEIALSKTGVLIRREGKLLSSFKDVEFSRLIVEDLVTKSKFSGMQIAYFYKGDKYVVFVDNDELKTLIKSIELVRDRRLSPEENVDYKFMCRSGLSTLFTFHEKQWGMFLDLGEEGNIKPIFIHEVADVIKLINILNAAVL